MKKRILFISGIDFKEKSIQVIRKTPEAYAKSGWDVHYLVARDNSKHGNYFYEPVLNPEGVHVYRFDMPLNSLMDKIAFTKLRTIILKISSYIVILKMAYKANALMRNEKFDILYGYEAQGVLAAALLRLFKRLSGTKTVSRFQGTWIYEYVKRRRYLRLMFNWDMCLALFLKSDLCIMTDDGTSGDKALKLLRSRSTGNLKFWVNGVEKPDVDMDAVKKIKKELKLADKSIIAVSVCRLGRWKRIDRAVMAVNKVVNEYKAKNFYYCIIGDGNQKKILEEIVKNFGLRENVFFTGGLPHREVNSYLHLADIFFSVNDLSNVGNPLLEAIRANKIIFTLNNGDTASWIKHGHNGFIYDINDGLTDNIARDIIEVIRDEDLRNRIISNIKITEKERLWTWDERLNAEIREVERILA